MDIYVYYRVHAEHAESLQAAIIAMQTSLAHTYGVHASLKRRADQLNQQTNLTWMETYAQVPAEFQDALDKAVQLHKLGRHIEGQRHIEIFEDMPACV